VPYKKQMRNRFFSRGIRLGSGPSAKSQTRMLSSLVLALCGFLATACDRGYRPTHIGTPAPQFALSDDTRAVNLANLRGHVVVLNFWASYCIPCIEELPSLEAMQHDLPQVTVLAISNDEDEAAYRKFLVDNHVDFLTVRDPSARVQGLYGTVKIPETYVIDQRGILRRKFVSAQNWTSPEILDYLGKM
jgi:cytochrome c biogenesis protein CcmG, thiol:disulfide interchange protein DsbE